MMPYAPKTGWTGDVPAKKNGQTNKIHLSIRFGGASGSRTLAPVSRPIAFRFAGNICELYIANMVSIYVQPTSLAIDKYPAPDKERAQLLWVAHMNGLKAQAEEVMVREIVYAE